MNLKLEAIVIPVSDVDRAKKFYQDTLGFRLAPGIHPERADYNSFMMLTDPDGNGWIIQEIKKRAPGR